MSGIPNLINKVVTKLFPEKWTFTINDYIERLIFCSVCLSGWAMIAISIYKQDLQFGIIHAPLAMYLAYLHTLVRFKLLK